MVSIDPTSFTALTVLTGCLLGAGDRLPAVQQAGGDEVDLKEEAGAAGQAAG